MNPPVLSVKNAPVMLHGAFSLQPGLAAGIIFISQGADGLSMPDAEGNLPDALARYLAGLADPDPMRRYRAAEALGRLRDPGAVEGLVRALDDTDWRVRYKAAWALGTIGDMRAYRPLEHHMQDPVDGVQEMIREALDRLRRGGG
ncbi:MAG: HEAT repeat domain-containing protein [Methanomicrobiales archaeon]|nr:HEAT repeat domain-containing protein [Methanomicrobiales archaeon]